MKKLIVLQIVGCLLFSIFVVLLVNLEIFSPVSVIILYACMGISNIVNAWKMLMKPIKDISDRDRLTGCFNRVKLDSMIPDYEDSKGFAVIFFDINKFKLINDMHGHDVGDDILIKATEQLKYWQDHGDLYRIGGDEFIAVLPKVTQDKLEPVIQKWHSEQPDLNEGLNDDFICNFSYGVAYSDKQKKRKFEEVLNEADEEMYKMKKSI